MKKFVVILLSLCLALAFAACGQEPAQEPADTQEPVAEQEPADEPEPAEEETSKNIKVEVAGAYSGSREVRVASIALGYGVWQAEAEVLAEMERVGQAGVDLIIAPEVWCENSTVTWNGTDWENETLTSVRALAKQYSTYIVVCMTRTATAEETAAILASDAAAFWAGHDSFKYNCLFLVDRQGEVVYTYDKCYPYPPEFNESDGASNSWSEAMAAALVATPTLPGTHTGIYECDFGTLGLAICFDMNFPDLWAQMAEEGAELVVWSSAFTGGSNASFRAGTNNYYVVSSCNGGITHVADITGQYLVVDYAEEDAATVTTEVTLNLDRTLFHKNFNETAIKKILEDYAGKVEADYTYYGEEEWILLYATDDSVSVKALTDEYGLLPMKDFRYNGVGDYIDGVRGSESSWR